MTTNHKREREPITKEKLVLEIAKLVERHIEAIKVSIEWKFDAVVCNVNLLGPTRLRRRSIGEGGIGEASSRIESLLAAGALVRDCHSRW